MPAYFSHADNFMNAGSSNVDPRTGLYSCAINLAQNSRNNFRGPKLPLMLGYTPYLDDNYGFGNGWTLNFSTYDSSTGIINASSGESYAVNIYGSPTQVKLPGFQFRTSDDDCRVEHSDGTVEILSGTTSAYNVKPPHEDLLANRRRLQTRVDGPARECQSPGYQVDHDR